MLGLFVNARCSWSELRLETNQDHHRRMKGSWCVAWVWFGLWRTWVELFARTTTVAVRKKGVRPLVAPYPLSDVLATFEVVQILLVVMVHRRFSKVGSMFAVRGLRLCRDRDWGVQLRTTCP